ncbi:porin [Noviherbaspirillum massiliense]|uniref:porin n=1 Tax=Noviherbaspirillum massiliense TaxID=1465823 RepID=UPI000474A1DE|nr:porin [Noviherbaspirillum massiliense]
MKKATAVLGTLAFLGAGSALAQTNVQVMGAVDIFAGSMQNSGDKDHQAVINSGGMTTSWFGFKGSEDLGGGLRAEFALTGFFRGDTGESGRFGGDNLFSRDANVAIAGDFGRLQLGRALAPSFLPTILFNPFGDSFTFSPLVLHAYVPSGRSFGARSWAASNAGDSGWSNQIIYTTPTFGGLKANVHYQFGEVAGETGKNNIAVNALYNNGPLALAAFYHDVEIGNPNSTNSVLDATKPTASLPGLINYASIDRQKGYFLGASYNLNVVKLFATFQRNNDDTATALSMTDKTYSVGLSAPLGQGAVLADFASTRRDGSLVGDDLKRDTLSVGYDYNLSKRTDVYAVYMTDKVTDLDRGNSFGVGIRHRF